MNVLPNPQPDAPGICEGFVRFPRDFFNDSPQQKSPGLRCLQPFFSVGVALVQQLENCQKVKQNQTFDLQKPNKPSYCHKDSILSILYTILHCSFNSGL